MAGDHCGVSEGTRTPHAGAPVEWQSTHTGKTITYRQHFYPFQVRKTNLGPDVLWPFFP